MLFIVSSEQKWGFESHNFVATHNKHTSFFASPLLVSSHLRTDSLFEIAYTEHGVSEPSDNFENFYNFIQF